MPVFVGKVFTATQVGQRVESVACEKCGMAFHYELTRVGVGKGSAPYMLGQDSAADRATSAAQRNLTKRLSEEAELVPCPKCHWVNQELIDRYRRRQYRRAPLLIVILIVSGFFVSPIVAAVLTEALGYSSRLPTIVMLAVMAVSSLSPAWVLLARRQLRRRIDPNITYPRLPIVPPRTPPALVEQCDLKTGEMVLVPVAREQAPLGNTDWATFRLGQVVLPRVCCICLSPATTIYGSPLKVDDNSEVEVPLCLSCRAGLSRRWWFALVIVGAVSFALAAGLALAIPGGDAFGRWFVFCITGVFGALVGGVVIAGRVCRPYRMGVVDADRGIIKFSAINPAYTAMLAEQARASDGVTTR